MRRKPRRLSDALFDRSMLITGLVQGMGVLAITLSVYALVLSLGLGEGEARMLTFTTLVIGNFGMIFANRSHPHSILQTLRIPNPALWWVTGGALSFLVLVLALPFLRNLFNFAPLHFWEIGFIAAAGLMSILISESVKVWPIKAIIDRK